MAKVLGLDLSTNSAGWCLLEDNLGNEKLLMLALGVFEAGVSDINTKTNNPATLKEL